MDQFLPLGDQLRVSASQPWLNPPADAVGQFQLLPGPFVFRKIDIQL
jgi:hypothetical protein